MEHTNMMGEYGFGRAHPLVFYPSGRDFFILPTRSTSGENMSEPTEPDIMNHIDPAERRKFGRFPVKEWVVAAFTPFEDESHYTLLGRIVDIGKGGLAFEYSRGSKQETSHGLLDIFALIQPYARLETVPFRIVYDRQMEPKNGHVDAKNRCGVEFSKLSDVQISQLNRLIDNFATTSPTISLSNADHPIP